MEAYLPEICAGKTLGHLIHFNLRTLKKYRKMNKVVDSIVTHLHRMPAYTIDTCTYSIKEVVKSGSLGKGTTIDDNADADLVIFFNGYQTMDELIKAKEGIITYISSYMNKFDRSVFSSCDLVRKNEYLGQYRLKHIQTNTFVNVDVLPALDVVKQRGSVDSVLKEMRYKPQMVRGHYSVCFCKEQMELTRVKPAKVKDLIRLMKYWKYSNDLPIRSYCCEVVCLYVFNECLDKQPKFNMKDGFIQVLQFLIETETPHTEIEPMFYYSIRDWFAVFPTLKDAARVREVARETVEALGSVPRTKRRKGKNPRCIHS